MTLSNVVKQRNRICISILYFVLFLHIYKPILSSISQYVFLIGLPCFIIMVACFICQREFFRLLRKKAFAQFSLGLFCLLAYTLAVDITLDSPSDIPIGMLNSVLLIRVYIDAFLTSIAMYVLFKLFGKSRPIDLLHAFLVIATLQFTFSLLMVTNPFLRDYINFHVLQPSKIIDTFHYQYRLFGFSSEQLFAFPLFNGLVVCSILWLTFKEHFSYLFLLAIPVLPILLNARIGLLGFWAFLISFIILYRKKFLLLKFGFILKVISFISIFSLFLFLFGHQIFQILPERTAKWMSQGASQVFFMDSLDPYSVEGSNTLNTLLENHLIIPDGFTSILIGESNRYLVRSDIGYVQMLFSGGIIFILFLVGLVFFYFNSAIKRSNDIAIKGILMGGLFLLLAANLKGMVFQSNGFLKGMFMLSTFVIIDRYDQKG